VTKPLATLAVFFSTLCIAVAYGSAFLPGGTPGWAPWLLAFGMSTCMVAIMVMGAARKGRVGRLALPFAFVFLVLTVGFGAALAHPGTDPANPELWLGLPPRAAIILYVIGFMPLLVIPLAYALTFDEQTLRPEDLERIRRHRTVAENEADVAAGAERNPARRASEPTEVGR
jgi:hypothetical protein